MLHALASGLYQVFCVVSVAADRVDRVLSTPAQIAKNAIRENCGAHEAFRSPGEPEREAIRMCRFNLEPGCETVGEYIKRYE